MLERKFVPVSGMIEVILTDKTDGAYVLASDAQSTIADLQGQVVEAQDGTNALLARSTELHKQISQLQQRVAQLEAILVRIANVPVDGDGRDYYWEGRDIAKQAIGKPTSQRYTTLQADHARVLGLVAIYKEAVDYYAKTAIGARAVMAIEKATGLMVFTCFYCSQEHLWLAAQDGWHATKREGIKVRCEAASLPAQPAQGGANG